jgi:hypothetical protein
MASHSSSSAKFPSVTLVVSLGETLHSSSSILALVDSTYPLSKVELILIGESRSAFDTALFKQARFKSIRSLVNSSKATFYSQIERIASGSIVLFTQGDCRPTGRWIKEMVAAFRRDREIGLVLGEVQWRTSDPANKVGDYCEQVGLDSAWLALGENSSYLSLKKREDSTDMQLEPLAAFLTPTNLALKRDALTLVAKSCHSFDRSLGRQEIEALENKKMRLFYQSSTTIERCPVMAVSRLGEMMTERGFRVAAWSRFGDSSSLRFRFQFAGVHEVSIPFFIPVDIAWGDFHWMHLWGIALLWKCLWICFQTHSATAAGDTDTALFEASLFGFFLFRYFLPVLKVQPWSDFILWCWLRYRSNMSMFWGGIKASVKFKCFQWSESW